MIHQITAMQWDAFDQPEWNTCNSIVDALTGLITATDAQSSSVAYHHVLYAVGNNHAGTYYPVLIAVLPFLEKIALEGEDWPQRTALSILDDLFASFSPEPDHEWIVVPNLGLQPTEAVFKQRLHMMRGALEHIVNRQILSSQIAQALLDLLNEDMT